MSTWQRTPTTLLHPNKNNYDMRRECNTKRKPHLNRALVDAILLWNCYSPCCIDGGELSSYLYVIKLIFLLKREVEDVFGKTIKFLKNAVVSSHILFVVCMYLFKIDKWSIFIESNHSNASYTLKIYWCNTC